jgi:hypothetical protein
LSVLNTLTVLGMKAQLLLINAGEML